MKHKTFFEKFNQFADAPNAVAMMRGLVLELAVTGKLVAQDKSESPASVLLDAVRENRKNLIAAREIKSRSDSTIQEGEQPFKLPQGWVWARLSDVAHSLGQKVPENAFTYINVGSIDSEKGRVSDRVEKLNPHEAPSRARKVVAQGTVIYSTVRPYLLNIAIIDRDFNPEPIVSTAFGILHPFEGIHSRYLFYWLRSNPFTTYVQSVMKGMAYPSINGEKFYNGPIALPPSAEQKRIALKVDGLMVLCDRLETQQRERKMRHIVLARASLSRFASAPNLQNLNILFHNSFDISPEDIRKCILTLAVLGKLVIQDHNDEPAENCLNRLGLKSTAPTKRKPSPVHNILPSSWTLVHFEDIALVTGGITLGRNTDDRDTVSVPYLRVANVKRGKLDLGLVKEVSIPADEIERYALRENDLLMTEGGDWDKVGRAAIWKGQIPICLHQNHVFCARMRSIEVAPVWFEHYFNSPEGRHYFEAASKQTTNLASINMRQVRNCPVPFPPIAEQHRIASKVNHLMSLVDQLETELAISQTTAEKLLKRIVVELSGIKRSLDKNQAQPYNTHMKPKVNVSPELRALMEPLKFSTRSFVLRRFAMATGYRSLGKFDCIYHAEQPNINEASPICLVGLNGSGKSNLIEAIAEIFCFLELINLPWKKVASASSRYRENRHRFELEYTLEDENGKRLIRIRKSKKNGAEFFIVSEDGTENPVKPGRDQLLLLPRRIIGSSGKFVPRVQLPGNHWSLA